MAYYGNPSTFDPIITVIGCTVDPCDAQQVAAVSARVMEMLGSRIREEVDGQGDLRADFAKERISGSLTELHKRRRQALKAAASPQFVELIDRVIAEAEAARDAAPRREVAAVDAGPRLGTWATVEVDEPKSLLPDFLQDI